MQPIQPTTGGQPVGQPNYMAQPYYQQQQQPQPYVQGYPLQQHDMQYYQQQQQMQYQPYQAQPQYYQQQPGYMPVQQQVVYGSPMDHQSQIIMVAPPMIHPPMIQTLPTHANGCNFPVKIHCPNCSNEGSTRMKTGIGGGTLCMSCLILLLCWPLAWLPCVMDDCKDKIHYCHKCGTQVGKKQYEIC